MDKSILPQTTDLALSSLSSNICAELAAGLSDANGIKRRYELTDNQWRKLKASPVFRAMLRDAIKRLHGDLNAGKRITLKSEIALEDSIPLLHEWAHNPEIAISNRLDAIKQMTVLAGRTGKEQAAQGSGAGNGAGFNVNIIIRGNEKKEIIDVTSIPVLEGEVAGVEEPSST